MFEIELMDFKVRVGTPFFINKKSVNSFFLVINDILRIYPYSKRTCGFITFSYIYNQGVDIREWLEKVIY